MSKDKKQRTMTASRAARVLGISREAVFSLVRKGKLKRAGYGKQHHAAGGLRRGHRVTLLTAESVWDEKLRRKAAKSWRDGGIGIDSAPHAETRPERHQSASQAHNDGKPATASEMKALFTLLYTIVWGRRPKAAPLPKPAPAGRGEQSAAETELTEEQKCRAACLAARDMSQHHEELAKTAAECSKKNAQACRDFQSLCFWFSAISIGSAILCIVMAAITKF